MKRAILDQPQILRTCFLPILKGTLMCILKRYGIKSSYRLQKMQSNQNSLPLCLTLINLSKENPKCLLVVCWEDFWEMKTVPQRAWSQTVKFSIWKPWSFRRTSKIFRTRYLCFLGYDIIAGPLHLIIKLSTKRNVPEYPLVPLDTHGVVV